MNFSRFLLFTMLVFVLLGMDVCAVAQLSPDRSSSDRSGDNVIIRNIKIVVRPMFDDLGFDEVKVGEVNKNYKDVKSSLDWAYQTANDIKASTRESVICRELLFKSGDVLDEFVIAESERNLRSLSFLRKVKISFTVDNGYADVLVSVQDTWTLFPQMSFSSGGGTNRTSLGIVERNVLGFGKRVEMLYADDEGRDTIEGVYDDNRFLNTRNRLLLGHFYRVDGYRSLVSLSRPFRSLVDKSAWNVSAEVSDLVGKLYENGDERFIFRQEHTDLSASFSKSYGEPDKLVRRYTLGYDYVNDVFSEASQSDYLDVDVDPENVLHDPSMLADDRKFSGPFFAFRQIEPHFISLDYIDRFERVQDFNLGVEWSTKIGVAPKTLGSDADTLFLSMSRSSGIEFRNKSILRSSNTLLGRVGDGGLSNAVARFEGKLYSVLGPRYMYDIFVGRHTLAGSVVVDAGLEFDSDLELLLGAANGLRGYKDRTFTGSHRLIINLEDRIYLVEDVFKVASFGCAVFADIGGVSSNSVFDILDDRLYGDVGVGLRVGFPRSSGGSVLRFDVAVPLRTGPDDSEQFKPRFLMSFGQVFDSALSSESSQAKQANVDIGL